MKSFRPVEIRRVLLLGAHSDDIEIGCGGTVLRFLAETCGADVAWAVFSGGTERQQEARASASAFLIGAQLKLIHCFDFKDGFFPKQWAEIKEEVEGLRREFEPDVIFTHCREDRHQDHRVLSDLAWNTFRNHTIFEYEIPKYDGDLGSPNVFVPLDEDVCHKKVQLLLTHFGSQRNKGWFSADLFLGLMRMRGMECASPSGFAEGFYCRKLVTSFRDEEAGSMQIE